MATPEVSTHPFPAQDPGTEIKIHICPLCRKDIAAGLDAEGFPTACKACRSRKRRQSESARNRGKANRGQGRRP